MIKVLIVEDDPMVADINKGYTESVEGYKVIKSVSNGEQALEYLMDNDIDLAIVDIYMPEMDGITFIKKMRQLQIESDVIFVTASNDVNDINTSLKYGAVDYLIKPFKFDRLISTLENYKERFNMMEGKTSIKQEEFDRLTKGLTDKIVLPKGLQEKTLEMILEIIDSFKDKQFAVSAVSDKSGISTVTVRRYLEYLEETGKLKSEIFYGTGGRPKSLYRIIS